jgi:hypothetical protein
MIPALAADNPEMSAGIARADAAISRSAER